MSQRDMSQNSANDHAPIRGRDLDLDSSEKVAGPARYTREVSRHHEGAINPNAMTPVEMMKKRGTSKDTLPQEFNIREGSSGRKVITKQPYQIKGTGLIDPNNHTQINREQAQSETAQRNGNARVRDRKTPNAARSYSTYDDNKNKKVAIAAVVIFVVVILLIVLLSRL